MFDALLKSKFYTKSKSAIKLTKTRIEMIKRKRNAMQKYLKNDVSDLLKNGLDTNAYGRMDGLWSELNFTSCYDFIEKFCATISSHLSTMDKQRECPEECREAVSSLMFAAAGFADLPELRELRALFTERYGNFFECYINKEFVNKRKATPPTKEMKLQFMHDIASEAGIEWNSKALEEKLCKQGRAKIDESIQKTMDDAAEKILNKGTGDKHENPRRFTVTEEKIEDLPSSGIKELSGDESNSPRKRERVVAAGKRLSSCSLYEGAEDSNSIKHVQEARSNRKEQQKNEPQTIRSASGEEDNEKPFYYKPFPPHTKSRMSIDSSLAALPTDTDAQVPEHTKTPGNIDTEDHLHQGTPNGKVKPVGKSVRRRFLKPQPGTDQEGEKQSRQERKALDQDTGDEEERKLDWLLAHYSKKKSSSSNGGKLEPVVKLSPQQAAADNTECGDMIKDKGKGGPTTRRTASLPNEPSSVEAPRKGQARAASFQAENCHVHPKLPDYDDFVARLAALRRN